MAFVKSMTPDNESVSAVMGGYGEQAKALFALTQQVMRTGDSRLDAGQRELIAAYTSQLNSCNYCFGTHQATAAAFGVDVAVLEAVEADIDAAAIDPAMKPVLRYVKTLTLTPAKLTQADADAIFAAGWDENDFHYVVMVCALFNFFNRMIEGYGVQNVADFWAARGATLAERGYVL
ncbi:MAG: peroxidase-related enzyme [Pseudomonadota bacterium]